MRFLALLLTLTLTLPAQQVASAPQEQKPAAPPVNTPPVPMNEIGPQSTVVGTLADTTTHWVTSGSYWRQSFTRSEAQIRLRAPVRLQEFVVDGKLTLSLKNYLDLVMVNNTDVEIQRVTLEIPKNSIQRAFGVFDPFVNSTFSSTRSNNPATNTLQGADIVSQLNQPFTSRIQQQLDTGTQVFGGVNISKLSTNDQFQRFNPGYNSSFNTGFTQPLLRNFGRSINRLPITIARTQYKSSVFSYEDQINRLLVNAENVYWDVISARERLKVQEESLRLADQALKRAQRELELGATSPLEIYQPQQQYATAEIGVIQVRYQLQQAEDVLRRQIGADLEPRFRQLPIVLTENVDAQPPKTDVDVDALVQTAIQKRPDLSSTRTNIEVNDYQIKSAQNRLRPLMNLTGNYSTNGRGGPFLPPGADFGVPRIPGGLGDSFAQWFDYNTYGMGVTLTLPLRDRATSADLSDAVVNKRLNALRVRSLEQQVRQEVLNATSQLESNREGIRLAQIAVDFAQKRVEADQKRYDLGVITIFFLLSAQTDLTTAQSNLVNQAVQYKRSLLQLQQRTGTLLDTKGIVLQ